MPRACVRQQCSGRDRDYGDGGGRTRPHLRPVAVAVGVVVDAGINCLGLGQSSGHARDSGRALIVAVAVVNAVAAATAIAVTGGGCG